MGRREPELGTMLRESLEIGWKVSFKRHENGLLCCGVTVVDGRTFYGHAGNGDPLSALKNVRAVVAGHDGQALE